ncbi:hypothetical protein NXY07_07955 [Phocaeicola dorei]|nr:hypothetical protein [Phocaeicola dorei]
MARALLFPAPHDNDIIEPWIFRDHIFFPQSGYGNYGISGRGQFHFYLSVIFHFLTPRNNFHPRQMRKYMSHSSSQDLG